MKEEEGYVGQWHEVTLEGRGRRTDREDVHCKGELLLLVKLFNV